MSVKAYVAQQAQGAWLFIGMRCPMTTQCSRSEGVDRTPEGWVTRVKPRKGLRLALGTQWTLPKCLRVNGGQARLQSSGLFPIQPHVHLCPLQTAVTTASGKDKLHPKCKFPNSGGSASYQGSTLNSVANKIKSSDSKAEVSALCHLSHLISGDRDSRKEHSRVGVTGMAGTALSSPVFLEGNTYDILRHTP